MTSYISRNQLNKHLHLIVNVLNRMSIHCHACTASTQYIVRGWPTRRIKRSTNNNVFHICTFHTHEVKTVRPLDFAHKHVTPDWTVISFAWYCMILNFPQIGVKSLIGYWNGMWSPLAWYCSMWSPCVWECYQSRGPILLRHYCNLWRSLIGCPNWSSQSKAIKSENQNWIH